MLRSPGENTRLGFRFDSFTVTLIFATTFELPLPQVITGLYLHTVPCFEAAPRDGELSARGVLPGEFVDGAVVRKCHPSLPLPPRAHWKALITVKRVSPPVASSREG